VTSAVRREVEGGPGIDGRLDTCCVSRAGGLVWVAVVGLTSLLAGRVGSAVVGPIVAMLEEVV
jgi:hypothetical protein